MSLPAFLLYYINLLSGIASQTEEELQILMKSLSVACKVFGLIISLLKTKILSQGSTDKPFIKIDNFELGVVKYFTFVGSNISESLSLDTEINKRIGKVSGTLLSKITGWVWIGELFTQCQHKNVSLGSCIINTLLYGSEMRHPILDKKKKGRYSTWEACILSLALNGNTKRVKTNVEVFKTADLKSMLSQCWLGLVMFTGWMMDDCRIPKDVLYGELKEGEKETEGGCPLLRHEGPWHWSVILGKHCLWPRCMEKNPQMPASHPGRKVEGLSRWKAWKDKKHKSKWASSSSLLLHLWQLWQRLHGPHRSPQPQQEMPRIS